LGQFVNIIEDKLTGKIVLASGCRMCYPSGMLLDCNGDPVPLTGIYMVSQMEKMNPDGLYEKYRPTGVVEYYIDGVRVTEEEHHEAIKKVCLNG